MNKFFFLIIGIIFFFAASGCGSDDESSTSKTGGETEVEISLKSTGQMREAIAEEDAIKTVDLLVFDASLAGTEDQAVFLYSKSAWQKSDKVYRATLKIGQSLNIYCAVNAHALVVSAGISSGMTYAQVKERLVMAQPNQLSVETGLPMWGHAALPVDIIGDSNDNLGTVNLLRSVASTDVTVSAGNFVLEKAHIVFASNKGYLPYSEANIGTDGQATAPEAPSDAVMTAEWSYALDSGDANAVNNVFYMFENDADGTAKRYTKLIVEGVWDNTGRSTFYPINFRNPDTNQKLQVTRNTKYVVVITNVNGHGYESIEEAKQAEDVNMDYEVIEWNQNNDGEIKIDGAYYFSIISKTALLPSQSGATEELLFETNFSLSDISMKYNETDEGVQGTIDTHPRFKVETVEKTDAEGKTVTCFEITTKQEYGDNDNPATLIVTVGRIKFALYIQQMQNYWDDGGSIDVEVKNARSSKIVQQELHLYK